MSLARRHSGSETLHGFVKENELEVGMGGEEQNSLASTSSSSSSPRSQSRKRKAALFRDPSPEPARSQTIELDSDGEVMPADTASSHRRRGQLSQSSAVVHLSDDEDEDIKPIIERGERPSPAVAPPAGSPRRKLFDAVLAAVPDVHPAFLLVKLNEAGPKAKSAAIVADFETINYPLKHGGYKDGGVRPAYIRLQRPTQCQCCFEENVPPDLTAHCQNGHVFCSPCITKFAEHAVGAHRSVRPLSLFTRIELKRTVRAELLDALAAIETEEAVEAADLPGLEKCPFCPFAAVVDERETIFRCEGCKVASCRTCRKKDHGARPCNEKELDALAAQHLAAIKHCPGCKLAYQLTDGCNNARFCHVCLKRTQNPAHWREGPVDDGRCPASDDVELRMHHDITAARARALTQLASRPNVDLPTPSPYSTLNVPAPKRKPAELARRAATAPGRHRFRSPESSLDVRPAWLPVPNVPVYETGYGGRGAGGGGWKRARQTHGRGFENAQAEKGRERDAKRHRAYSAIIGEPVGGGGYANELDKRPYGYKSAGSGVFGGGGWGGNGVRRWSGGKGTALDQGREGPSGSSGWRTHDGPARDEPEELKRQRLMVAATKRLVASRAES
ncbi:hypothetical protein Rhopal_000289-T1 [Rhodotorula paludigena]|uniref:RING-type domain-containing protein n=1 Tax=Rhodotorula paludigena TaxID=86838 RepID=A0AAV5GC49_9BASI|nr:hypothetical protein Rhopal_000289-T1 [Rhodotorula paludigena]